MDWGDMQVEPDVRDPRELDEHSHLTIDTYDNAMFLLAIRLSCAAEGCIDIG